MDAKEFKKCSALIRMNLVVIINCLTITARLLEGERFPEEE